MHRILLLLPMAALLAACEAQPPANPQPASDRAVTFPVAVNDPQFEVTGPSISSFPVVQIEDGKPGQPGHVTSILDATKPATATQRPTQVPDDEQKIHVDLRPNNNPSLPATTNP